MISSYSYNIKLADHFGMGSAKLNGLVPKANSISEKSLCVFKKLNALAKSANPFSVGIGKNSRVLQNKK